MKTKRQCLLAETEPEAPRHLGLPPRHLSRFFGITPGMWMNLQLDYEFMRADREKAEAIRKEVQPCAA